MNTHALPPLSYLVPPELRRRVTTGSLVVVRLSGRSELGVVVGLLPDGDDRAREEILRVVERLRLPSTTVSLCLRVCEEAAALWRRCFGPPCPRGWA